MITEVGACYWQIGILLLNDTQGSRMKTIIKNCLRQPDEIAMEILWQWVDGCGQPVTWDVLVKALEDVNLGTFAQDIRDEKLSTPQKEVN